MNNKSFTRPLEPVCFCLLYTARDRDEFEGSRSQPEALFVGARLSEKVSFLLISFPEVESRLTPGSKMLQVDTTSFSNSRLRNHVLPLPDAQAKPLPTHARGLIPRNAIINPRMAPGVLDMGDGDLDGDRGVVCKDAERGRER